MEPISANRPERANTVRNNQGYKILPVCFLCNRVPDLGIRSGFYLRGIFICHSCEAGLINAGAQEKEEYLLAISKLRRVLFKENPRC